jgi:hypothetical protein
VGGENWLGHPAGVGASSLDQADKTWKPNQLQGRVALVVAGKGFGQFRVIASNSANRVVLAEPWRIPPDKDSWVVVRQFFFENLLVNNTSRLTRGGLELTGALNNVVDRFVGIRSRNGIWLQGVNIGPADRLSYGPVAFNELRDCLLDDCGSYESSGGLLMRFSGVRLWSRRHLDKMQPVPTLFGNRFSSNQFERCGILTEDQVLQSRPSVSWLLAGDPRRGTTPPAIVFNAFGPDRFSALLPTEPAVRLDGSTLGSLLWGLTAAEGAAPRVTDEGSNTKTIPR